MYDACGGSLVSLIRLQENASLDESSPIARSLVIVRWGRRVLLGFNVGRKHWELPGGAVELVESAHEAPIRELAEETDIRVDRGRRDVVRATEVDSDQVVVPEVAEDVDVVPV